MYLNSTFTSFGDLSQNFGLPQSSSFQYFQIRHFRQHQVSNFPSLTLPSGLDDLLRSPFNSKRLIATINDHISSFRNTTLAKIRADWLAELGEELEDTWESALLRVSNSTPCAQLNIQFKILHCIHYSKVSINANCDRC